MVVYAVYCEYVDYSLSDRMEREMRNLFTTREKAIADIMSGLCDAIRYFPKGKITIQLGDDFSMCVEQEDEHIMYSVYEEEVK